MKRSNTTIVAIAAMLATLVAATAAFAEGPSGKTLYRYVGQLDSKTDSSLTVTVQNGNRAALRSLLGASQQQTFTTSERTVFLKWENGVPTQVRIGDLEEGDYVAVNVRAGQDASLERITGTPAALVGDHGKSRTRPDKPLYLFRGTLVSTAGSTVSIDVKGGNRRALRLMIGQQAGQSFSTDGGTVFLRWDNRIPTVIAIGDLKEGDRIIVRVRADKGSTLAEVEATPAVRVAAREPRSQESNQNDQA